MSNTRIVRNKNRQRSYNQEPYTPEHERLGVKPEVMFDNDKDIAVAQREAILRRQMKSLSSLPESGTTKEHSWTNQVEEKFIDNELPKVEVPQHLANRNYEFSNVISVDEVEGEVEDIDFIEKSEYLLIHEGEVLEAGSAKNISDAILSINDNDIDVKELTVFKRVSFTIIPREVVFNEKDK